MRVRDLRDITKFRVKGRIPILSFVNHNKRYFYRSSQISTGMFSNRSKEDEMMLFFMGNPLSEYQPDYYLKF